MAQSKVTLNEIMKAVRELTFDRFIIPAFAIKQIGSGNFIEIDPSFEPEISDPNVEPVKGKLTLYKVAEGETEESSKNRNPNVANNIGINTNRIDIIFTC
jgi:hypothetical protein